MNGLAVFVAHAVLKRWACEGMDAEKKLAYAFN
jgi:hypothetical protein